MALNPTLQRLREVGVSIWLDILSRDLLESGGFAELRHGQALTRREGCAASASE